MAGKAQNAAALAATLGATTVAKKAVDATWKAGSRGKEPPTDPADPEVRLAEAVLFAAISGAVISVLRMFIARRFARHERRENRVHGAVGH